MGRHALGAKEAELQELPLFAACRPHELRRAARAGDIVTVPAGATLTVQGRRAREFGSVLNGLADVTVDGRRVGLLGPGQHYGEVELLRDAPSGATIRARTALRLYVVDPRRFAALVLDVPIVAWRLLRAVAGQASSPVEAAV